MGFRPISKFRYAELTIFGCLLFVSMLSAQSSLPIIVDTDAGADDMMALAYLLSSRDARIEAITVVHGVAHVSEGSRNIRRLLNLAGKPEIPVFEGEERPLQGLRPFPADWRALADKLPGVALPEIGDTRSPERAVSYLKRRLKDRTHPVRILALGPLTHLAVVLRDVPEGMKTIDRLVILGGAVSVPGNLSGGNPEKAANEVAEWNIYADPHAAAAVFKVPVTTLLVPLDATMRVPITRPFVEDFRRRNLTPLGRVVAQLLESSLPLIDTHMYFAWDPLAAAALLDSSIVTAKPAALNVVTAGKDVGRTKLARWNSGSKLRVAVDADPARFQTSFERAFAK